MIGVTRRDRIQNTAVRERTNVTESIIEEIRRRRLSWFGHISRMESDRLPVRALLPCYWRMKPRKTSKKVDGKHQGRL